MLRIVPLENAKQAESYYSKSDGGYYLDADDLRREWVGRGADLLKLHGPPDYEQFRRLIHGLDPHSGSQLTAKLIDDRVPGWDVNLHCAKGVTLAIERGDARLQDAFWESAKEAIADLERYATTRVRKGKQQDDRLTGNLVGYAVEHPETRPAKEDKMPDPHRHIHVVIMNLTHDDAEGEWKAVKFRPIMDLRKYFDRRFNQRFAHKAASLGYEIETKWDRDSHGGRRYVGWDIKGIPDSVITKFSRRTTEIEKLAAELGVTDAVSKDQLGAKSRLHKRKDLTLADYREYWDSRVTAEEAQQIAETIRQAKQGGRHQSEPQAEPAMQYAIDHHFTRHSVVPVTTLETTAMERCMGTALPEDVERTAVRQGLLARDGEATTKEVLAEERWIINFARDGRGTCRPLGAVARPQPNSDLTLSPEQEILARHVWESTDRAILIRGGAGTGKTTAMRSTIAGIDKPVVVLAPSADASRGTLRREGFKDAETVAQFLDREELQAQAKDGVIWIDEATLLPIKELRKVLDRAEQLHARVVLQGDPNQHQSVDRGAIFDVLQQYAGLPVAELKDIRRQSGEYKRAVAAIDRGDLVGGFDVLANLGWVKETGVFDRYHELVDEYLAGVKVGKSMLVVAPTHQEGDEITAAIRERLKEEGLVGREEHAFASLKPLGWTEAQRADLGSYTGTEIVQFHRNSGPFKAGQRIEASQLNTEGYQLRPEHFSVYAPSEIKVAKGDTIRVMGNGKDETGQHKVNNGATYTVADFTPAGGIRLNNGWVLGKDFGLINHGYVNTSFGSQGRTVDRALIAMGRESTPAINAAQFYVSVSRARERCTIYSNMSRPVLRDTIQRSQPRKSATELMSQPKARRRFRHKAKSFMKEVRDKYRQLREKAQQALAVVRAPQREVEHAR